MKVPKMFVAVIGSVAILIGMFALAGVALPAFGLDASIDSFVNIITGTDPHIITGTDPHIITGTDPHIISGLFP
ncbi:MAG: hypothetical protein WC375_06725 [Methanomassiliicoccales archaeon]|jgi:methanogenic corrinoid protein MtbC1